MRRLAFQGSPEGEWQPESTALAELKKALSFHGLTEEDLDAEVIKWLPSVMLTSPRVYNALVTDPPEIKHRISKYDFYFSAGLTVDTARRRGWTDFMAIREFIQNAMDIEERMYGREGIAIAVYQDEQGIHILDRGPGIPYKAFRIGASDKAPYERGFFGEGLKIAAAHLVDRGCIIYIFNRKGQVFKITRIGELVQVVMGVASEPVRPPFGTEVVIYNARLAPDFLENVVYQQWLRAHPEAKVYEKTYGSPPRPNMVVSLLGTDLDVLWVRDIVVGKISMMTGKKAIFGYNLWWVELDPNRVMVRSLPPLYSKVAEAYTRDAVIDLLNRVIVDMGKYAIVKDGYFETELVNWWDADSEVKTAVAEYVMSKGLGVLEKPEDLNWMIYMGVKPLVLPRGHEIHGLFVNAPKAEEIANIKGMMILATAEGTSVPIEFLTFGELMNLRYVEELLKAAHNHVLGWWIKMPNIIVSEVIEEREGARTEGVQSGDNIYVLRKNLRSIEETAMTLFHEYSHWLAKRHPECVGKGSTDFTVGFERAMAITAGGLSRAASSAVLNNVLRRIYNGGWNAKYLEWDEDKRRYEHTRPLFHRFLDVAIKEGGIRTFTHPVDYVDEYINSSAKVAVMVPIKDVVEVASMWYTVEAPRDVIHESVTPLRDPEVRNMYMDAVKRLIEKEWNETEVMRWIKRREAKGAIIFIYDPWKDEYVVYKRYTL